MICIAWYLRLAIWGLEKPWGYPWLSSISRWDFPWTKPSSCGVSPWLWKPRWLSPSKIILNHHIINHEIPWKTNIDDILVGGLEHQFYFPIYWVANHPNWLSYFSEGFKPPTRWHCFPHSSQPGASDPSDQWPTFARMKIPVEGTATHRRCETSTIPWSRA